MQHLMKFQVYPLKDVTLEKEEKLTQKKKKIPPIFVIWIKYMILKNGELKLAWNKSCECTKGR